MRRKSYYHYLSPLAKMLNLCVRAPPPPSLSSLTPSKDDDEFYYLNAKGIFSISHLVPELSCAIHSGLVTPTYPTSTKDPE